MSINHHSKSYWVGTIKPMPVIWAFSTGLYVLTVKSLVSTKALFWSEKFIFKRGYFFVNPDAWTFVQIFLISDRECLPHFEETIYTEAASIFGHLQQKRRCLAGQSWRTKLSI